MSGQIRPALAAAALVFASLAGGISMAQNAVQPGTSGRQSLGQNPNAANVINEVTGSSGNLIGVPLNTIVPGGVQIPQIESPVANDPSAPERGMKYFIGFNCVGCHAANGGGGMGPSLSNSVFIYGPEPAQMYNVISHGTGRGMPAWGTILPDNAIWDIIAYIGSISKAPTTWGTTVNIALKTPSIEQVPAEFMQTTTPWQHTQPFSSGEKPTEHKPTTSYSLTPKTNSQ